MVIPFGSNVRSSANSRPHPSSRRLTYSLTSFQRALVATAFMVYDPPIRLSRNRCPGRCGTPERHRHTFRSARREAASLTTELRTRRARVRSAESVSAGASARAPLPSDRHPRVRPVHGASWLHLRGLRLHLAAVVVGAPEIECLIRAAAHRTGIAKGA